MLTERLHRLNSAGGPPRAAGLQRLAVLLLALLSTLLFGLLFTSFPVLYDTDSYYHLGIARLYAEEGVVDQLPWLRFSLLRDGFGDKELLFHLLMVPLAGGEQASLGGRWALALWNGLLVGLLAALGARALRRPAGRRRGLAWGVLLLVPWVSYFGSLAFLGRAVRLRPELLALALLLLASWCAGSGRFRWLGVVAVLFALSYTAFHALVGLCFLWFLQQGWMRRCWHWRLLLYSLLGTVSGLLLHPHLPHNLRVWKVQSIDFFRYKSVLDVGTEIGSQSAADLLLMNLPWALVLGLLWLARRPMASEPTVEDRQLADVFAVAAVAWCGLYCLMLRFSTYAIPFFSLALLFGLRARGFGIGARISLWGRGTLPLWSLLLLPLLVGGYRSQEFLSGLSQSSGTELEREEDWTAFGRALPPGARVAAEWGATHNYFFFAPHGRYLNVLDPVFMALPFAAEHASLRAVMEGREADIPLALRQRLDSDFLALSRFHRHPALLRQLEADPRFRLRYGGYTLLYELVAEGNQDFVLDWRLVPRGTELPVMPDQPVPEWPAYPRLVAAELRASEGLVDCGRLQPPSRCQALVHDFQLAKAERRRWELAPVGVTSLWLDGRALASTGTLGAVLGAGVTLPVKLDAGAHRLTILTCSDGSRPAGFFLLER